MVGKFHPLHKGHEFLLNYAGQICQQVSVIVDNYTQQTIHPSIRANWIRELFPAYAVTPCKRHNPQSPEECEDFWEIWRNIVLEHAGQPDYIVGSETYITKLAKEVNATPIFCDIPRANIPISATKIKRDLIGNWDMLTKPSQLYYQKRILLMGAESSGKTTTGQKLAKQLDGSFVPEYVSIQMQQERELNLEMLKEAIIAQCGLEKSTNQNPRPFIICDSDYLTTQIWAKELYNATISDPSPTPRVPDLVLLFPPTTEWVADKHRLPAYKDKAKREAFFETCVCKVKEKGWNYHILSDKDTVKEAKKLASQLLYQYNENIN